MSKTNSGTGVVDDPSSPYDGKTTLAGLPYLGRGYAPDLETTDAVVVLKCADSGDPAVWTTDEQFNEERSEERASVTDDGTLAWGGGWECPLCGDYHAHDVALAQGADPDELLSIASDMADAGGNA